MEGRVLSHYRVLAHLGGGGMGVVYRAEDTRLKRQVALKFLPQELTSDVDARERFMFEAQAASALDHPNICTIYEIDSASDGQLFIAMALCDGATLKKRIERGTIPVSEAVAIGVQVARGLDKAHHAGIIHRDIKPANLMLTSDGLVKIVDFGIAKLLNHTGPTRTGTTLGTLAYMAPEQIRGASVDARADIWALGVVMYQMLSGRLPFQGDHEVAILNSIVHQEPPPLKALNADVSDRLFQAVHRALAKDPGERFASASEFAHELELLRAPPHREDQTAGDIAASAPGIPRTLLAVIGTALVVAALVAGWFIRRQAAIRQAEQELAEITRLADADRYGDAVRHASALERAMPDDPRLTALWERIALRRAITTEPAGADVRIKPYGTDEPGVSIGRTPIADARLPKGPLHWTITKDGYDTREFLTRTELIPADGMTYSLARNGEVPDGMVRVPGSGLSLTLQGYDYMRRIDAGDFLIDRYEVTNRQFRRFVESDGYAKREYWTQPFVKDGRDLSWDEAMKLFRDRTGRPGPATWEVGTSPADRDNDPVGGLSWYEAVAYAQFSGKNLPTVYHWLRAAGTGAAASLTPLSNFDGTGLAPIGKFRGLGPFGTYDMAGNLKEWCWNAMTPGQGRYILGGAWNDPPHMFVFADARSPFDRSEVNGFRLVKYLDDKRPEALARNLDAPSRDFKKETPVPDDVFRVIRNLYAYDAVPLDPDVETRDASAEHWTKEKVHYRAAYGDERAMAYLFLPKHARPPYQTVVFAPGAGAVQARSSATLPTAAIDFLLIGGRAVLLPVYKGTYERGVGRTSVWPEATRAYQDWMIQVVNDARRGIDYLETRPDIRRDGIGYYGSSWGGMFGSIVVALEPRVSVAVFLDAGLTPSNDKPREVDQFNFAPRVTVPTLMVNGGSDYIYQVDISQKPLFALLGTPPDRKRHVIFPSGHGVLGAQRSQVVREILDWFDRYLGPVAR